MSPERPRPSARGSEFEREVAAIFRALGAKVETNVDLAGNQIDALITEKASSGANVRFAVECKAYSRPVGIDVVNSFGRVAYLLKQRALIDKALLVSDSGFSVQARDAATQHGVDLLEIADLRGRAKGREALVRSARTEIDEEASGEEDIGRQRAFVIMPFSRDFDDVYILGIREVAEKLGMTVERADSIEHNEGILDTIKERIRACDVVIADVTAQNPNVLYELGYSHAVDAPTIVICRADEAVPFDLRGVNFIVYDLIVDLREKLERRLRATVLRRE